MDITELLDRVSQKQAEQAVIRMHPYGFLQLSLSDAGWRDSGYRIHVWSEQLPPMTRPEFQVHNHIYRVDSQVLVGELKDIQYGVKENPQGEYLVFQAADGKLINTWMNVSIRGRETSIITAGQCYFVDKWIFHSSESMAPLTVTLFRKSEAETQKAPLVIGPRRYEKMEILADERHFDQDKAWKIIHQSIEQIKK